MPSQFIRYSEDNDEPEDHQLAKQRLRGILTILGFEIVINTDKFEYQLKSYHNDIGDIQRQYTIDVMAYKRSNNSLKAIEVDGEYHFNSKESKKKLSLKKEIVTGLFDNGEEIMIDKKSYKVKLFKYANFKTEELIGKRSLDAEEVKKRFWGSHSTF